MSLETQPLSWTIGALLSLTATLRQKADALAIEAVTHGEQMRANDFAYLAEQYEAQMVALQAAEVRQ